MKRRICKPAVLLAALTLACVLPLRATAQTYPSKPVRLIVSYAAGNVTDVLARLVAEKLSERWGQQLVVDNRPGIGGSLGAQLAQKAPADGYTLLFSALAAFAINPHVYANVGYDALKDFAPVVNIAITNAVLTVSTDVPASNLRELIDYARANPGKLNFASAGSGTAPHLNLELLKQLTGVKIEHVPYKGAVAALADLVGGRVQMMADAITVLQPQIKAGRIKAIAAMGTRPLSQLPDLPLASEQLPNYQPVNPWLGILAPAGTPAEVIRRIHADAVAVLKVPATVERLAAIGLDASGEGPEEFARRIADDYARLGRLARSLNLKAD